MNHPAASSRMPAASPFTGSHVCAAAGLAITPGGRPVLFDQDLWDFRDVEGLPVQMHPGRLRLDFTAIADPRWRQVAKEYIFARLAPAHPAVAVLAGAYRMPLTLQTCRGRMREVAGWLNWLTSQQIPALGQVAQDHCDRYLAERRRRTDDAGQVAGALSAATLQAVAARHRGRRGQGRHGQALGAGRRRGHHGGRCRLPSVDAAAGQPGPARDDRRAPHSLPADHLGGDGDALQ